MGERERESEREREEQVLEQTYSGKKGLWNIPRSSAATTVAQKVVFLHRLLLVFYFMMRVLSLNFVPSGSGRKGAREEEKCLSLLTALRCLE